MTLHIEETTRISTVQEALRNLDLIPKGKNESLIEVKIDKGINPDLYFGSYVESLKTRYDVINSSRENDVYCFRIRRKQNA